MPLWMKKMKKRIGKALGEPAAVCGRRLSKLPQVWQGKKAILAVMGVCLLALFPLNLPAKQKPPVTKTISGAVLDASNNGISGASVMLTDSETHRTTAIYSGTKGFYSFSGLDPNHNYHVQAKYRGMVSELRGVSAFDTRTRIVINLVLNPPGNASNSQ